jgi:hypothetical protein
VPRDYSGDYERNSNRCLVSTVPRDDQRQGDIIRFNDVVAQANALTQ